MRSNLNQDASRIDEENSNELNRSQSELSDDEAQQSGRCFFVVEVLRFYF